MNHGHGGYHHHGALGVWLFAMLPGSSAIMPMLFAFLLMGWAGIVVPAILAVLLHAMARLNHRPMH
jgi:hypothetical protein